MSEVDEEQGEAAPEQAEGEQEASPPANDGAVDTEELQERLTRIEAALEAQASRSAELMQRLDAVLAEGAEASAAEPEA